MASYYVKYNDVDLTDVIRVRAVETTVLPPRENNSIMIWERPGSIYNSYRYGEREITVTFLIMASKSEYNSNPYVMEDKLNTLRNVFDVPEPKPLYLGMTTQFIYAVPEGEFKFTELRYDCYECEIFFKCYDPAYYSSEVHDYNNNNNGSNGPGNITVPNNGNTTAYPIISIGINTDNTTFVQVENQTNGNRLRMGDFPSAENPKSDSSTYSVILNDSMSTPSYWEAGTSYVDMNRMLNGNLITTNDKGGLTFTTPGSSTNNDPNAWKGASGKRSFSETTNFMVQVNMEFNCSSVDGDPSQPSLGDDDDPTLGGERNLVYYVNSPGGCAMREQPDIDSGTIMILPMGRVIDTVYEDSESNGYIKVHEDGRTGYIAKHNLSATYRDDTKKTHVETDSSGNVTSSYIVKNVVTKQKTELRSAPSTNSNESSIIATIPAGTAVRVRTTDQYGFYKLEVAYNGKTGYIEESKVTEVEGATVDYPQDEIKAVSEDQTGVCELYGWSASGTKLFKLSLTDDNKYSEYVKPAIQVGSSVILQENGSVPKNNTSNNNLTITNDPLANSSLNNWNDFYGELGIQRKGDKWKAWIYKMKDGTPVKKLEFNEQSVSGSSNEKLAYVTIYMGALDINAKCGMAITNIKVTSYDNATNIGNVTPTMFMKGDQLKIDCYNNKVYLNDKIFNQISIDSGYIGLVSGNNDIKVTSDDPKIVWAVMFNERHV